MSRSDGLGGVAGLDGTTSAERKKASAQLRAYASRRLDAIEMDQEDTTATSVVAKPKADRKDRRSAVQRAADHQREARRASWARMHPAAAAAERALRKERAQLLDDFRHKNQGTPETHAHATRRNEGALARLYRTGAIDIHQLEAADEIAAVAARIAAGVAVRTASFEGRVDRSGDGTFYEALGQVRREVAYGRWRDRLSALRRAGTAPAAAVLELIVGDARCDGPVAYTIVAAKYRMGARRAKALLIDALDLWILEVGHARQSIHKDDLARAHAELLGG